MQTFIIIKNQFDALHSWPGAPDEVRHLRSPHRHTFYIKTKIEVFHDDRELEFFMVKDNIDFFIHRTICPAPGSNIGSKSCERIAKMFVDHVHAIYGMRSVICEVSEDQQNAAMVLHYGENDAYVGRN